MSLSRATVTYANPMMKVQDFWERGFTGEGVSIGIVDHGIAKHEALPIVGGHACLQHKTYFYEKGDHHTHCAGIALARNLENGEPVGIAPNASHYVIRMYMSTMESRIKSIIEAIDYAIEVGIDILSISQAITENSARYSNGRTSSTGAPKHLRLAFRDAFIRAKEAGVIIVVPASSNEDEFNFVELLPKMPNVVAVTNLEKQDRDFPKMHDYNKKIVSAPGYNIKSIYADGSYARMSGVSMAVPAVAGLLALYKQAFPDISTDTLLDRFYNSAVITKDVPKEIETLGIPQPPPELYVKPVTNAIGSLRIYSDYCWVPVDSFHKEGNKWKEMEAVGFGK